MKKNNDEIDLILVLRKLYIYKKTIIYISVFFIFLGIVVALISPIKFSSSTVFIPQNQKNNSSSISGVASLIGLNLGSSAYGDDIPSTMYPQIGNSPKFKRLLLEKVIDFEKNLTLKNFLIEFYSLKQQDEVGSSSLHMTDLEERCFDLISEIITIKVNVKDGFVTINSVMPVAEYSAFVTRESREILQKIIIENKIETARQNLNFSLNQLAEKKLEFNEIQSKLAYFSDSNLNAVNSFVINEKDKLQAEFQIISAVVTELSKQAEQAKLQVTKDTPVFSTIREAVIPNKRTSPNRTQLVLIFSVVGFLISSAFVLIRETLIKIFSQIK